MYVYNYVPVGIPHGFVNALPAGFKLVAIPRRQQGPHGVRVRLARGGNPLGRPSRGPPIVVISGCNYR